MKLGETFVSLGKIGEGACRVKLQSSGNILIIICAKFVFKVDWRWERSCELTLPNRGVGTSENIYYICTYIHMYVCLLTTYFRCSKESLVWQLYQQTATNSEKLVNSYCSQETFEILAKKKVDCSSVFRVRFGVFLLVCLFTVWKMQTNEKCSYRKWSE